MKPIAAALRDMPRSGIREFMDLAAKLSGVLHLEVGEPGFATPPHIVEGACAALKQGFTKYTPNPGLLSLREAIVEKLGQKNGIRATVDEVCVTPGAVAGVFSVLFTILEQRDEVLIPDPYWPNCKMSILALRCKPVPYPLHATNAFLPDLDEIARLVTDKTKAIVVNSPSNPTGAVFPEAAVHQLVQFAAKHDLYLLSDEIYEDLVFEGQHFSAARWDEDGRVLTVFGFSKSYAMTGWRLGYVVSRPPVSNVLAKLQEPFVTCAAAVSQKAGEAALRGPQQCIEEFRLAYKRRRDQGASILDRGGVGYSLPHGAFYLLVDISPTGLDSYPFAQELLMTSRVCVAPGAAFGRSTEGWVRVSLAADDQVLSEGLGRLVQFVRERREAHS
jgi:aspartate/methionine/tyrosine aminotransferase